MKYIVTRASLWNNDIAPCKGAIQEDCTRIDERTVSKPERIGGRPSQTKEEIAQEWYSQGKNHRVERGHIKRDFHATYWTIIINTLEELMAFRRKHGRLIVGDYQCTEYLPTYPILTIADN